MRSQECLFDTSGFDALLRCTTLSAEQQIVDTSAPVQQMVTCFTLFMLGLTCNAVRPCRKQVGCTVMNHW